MAFWNRKRKEKILKAFELEIEESQEISQETSSEISRDNTDSTRESSSKQRVEEEIAMLELDPKDLIELNDSDKKRFVRECCIAVGEIDVLIAQIKKEYEHVTSRLTDIQRIDGIEGEQKKHLVDCSKKIMRLVQERNQYKNRNLTITDAQIRCFDSYESDLAFEVKKMYDTQIYQTSIESDLDHLKKEKKSLLSQQREIIAKQNILKSLAKILIVLIFSLVALLAVAYKATGIDMTYPYLAVILLAAISSTVIFIESNKNRHDIVVVGRKINKAVALSNRVKIKYTNNRNLLDYNREKFQVEDAKQFESLWHEYVRAKEYERKFSENTQMLGKNQDVLLGILKEANVAEPEVWLNQTLAIVDSREMVEIRHALNISRGKLRERLEYNEGVKTSILQRIDHMMSENEHLRASMIAILQEYQKKTKNH